MKHFAFLLLLILPVACASIVYDPLPPEQVDSRYSASVLNWTNGAQIIFVARVFEQDGQVAFCGARSHSGGGHMQSEFDTRAVHYASLRVGDRQVSNSVNAFAKLRHRPDEVPMGAANCFLTGLVWEPDYGSAPAFVEMGRQSITIRE